MMDFSQEYVITAVVNLFCCFGIFFACICRLKTKTAREVKAVRAKYTLLLAGSLVMGLQPALIGSLPSRADAMMSVVVFVYLLLGMSYWGKDANKQ